MLVDCCFLVSQSVVTVCTVTESCIRFVSGCADGQIPQQRNARLSLQLAVIERTSDKRLFHGVDIDDHTCKGDVLDSFKLTSVRLIVMSL
jgi:hypothetical protein